MVVFLAEATTPTITQPADDNYSLTVITVTSLALNAALFVMLLVRVTYRLVQSCSTTSLHHLQSSRVLLPVVTDEILNCVLIGLAIYCCLSLEWPRHFMTSPPPLSLITLVSANVARYVFRIVMTIECHLQDPQTPVILSHHILVLLLLASILAYSANWWFGVVAVFMEMNNILTSMRRSLKVINRSYWKAIAVKFRVIEIVAIMSFRLILPGTLMIIYVTHGTVNAQPIRTVPFIAMVIGGAFFGGYQVYILCSYCRDLIRFKNNKFDWTDNTPEIVVTNDKAVLLKSSPMLTNQLNLIKNDIKSNAIVNNLKRTESKLFPLKQTANVNTDQSPTRAKHCDKVLLEQIKNNCINNNISQT